MTNETNRVEITDDSAAWGEWGIQAAQRIGFELPEGTTMNRGPASEGVAYYFDNQDLGSIGRVRVINDGTGHGRLLGEVHGSQDDPLFSARVERLAPLVRLVHKLLTETAALSDSSSPGMKP